MLASSVKQLKFYLELFYTYWGRVTCLAFGMMALSCAGLATMLMIGISENVLSTSVLADVFAAIFLLAIPILAVGLMQTKSRRKTTSKRLAEIWRRGPI